MPLSPDVEKQVEKVIEDIKDKEVRLAHFDELESWKKYFERFKNEYTDAIKEVLEHCKSKKQYGRVFFQFDENNQKPDVSETPYPENFNHRFAGFIDLIPGSDKDVWIGWDFQDNKLVIIKEVENEKVDQNLKDRIAWELEILDFLIKTKDTKYFPQIIQKSDGSDSNWFAIPFNNCGDLEGILFPPRRRSENNIQDVIEGKLTEKNRESLCEKVKFFATEISKKNWNDSRLFFKKLITTVEELHKKGIAHLDIQPSNIHINYENDSYEVVLSDFDRAYYKEHKHDESLKIQKKLAKEFPGRSVCDAPERFKHVDEHLKSFEDAKNADIYSLGATIAGILLRKPEVFKEYTEDQHENVKKERESFRKEVKHSPELPKSIRNILVKAIDEKPEKRGSIDEFKQKICRKRSRWGKKWLKAREQNNFRNFILIVCFLLFIGFLFFVNYEIRTGEWKKRVFEIINPKNVDKHLYLKVKSGWWKKPYLLVGHIFVDDTLKIDSGVVIYADEGSSLTITQKGQIQAIGNEDNPIIFTPRRIWNQERDLIGFWGGITICGKAPIADNSAKTAFLEFFNEKKDSSNIIFGGSDSTHNSGTLQYVRIEYAGDIIQKEDKGFNGLSLAGVGTGTQIDHIWVYESGDDAFEFYGGTVRPHHIVAENTVDDALDFENGHTFKGKVELCLIKDSLAVNKKLFSEDAIKNYINKFISDTTASTGKKLQTLIDSIAVVVEDKYAIEGMENLPEVDRNYINHVTIYFPNLKYSQKMFSEEAANNKKLVNTLIFLNNNFMYNRIGNEPLNLNRSNTATYQKHDSFSYKLKVNNLIDPTKWIGAFKNPQDSDFHWDEKEWSKPYKN